MGKWAKGRVVKHFTDDDIQMVIKHIFNLASNERNVD